ncbi:redoxin domain-containing protein [Bythopirellula polymerisocia]|uniref:Thiol-disulfide oxidoreductase YkuV n=1 Tax=Bythopirellula polymerisocia TaxID=2528003 RepID=A0A5C6CX93_9BACT|nr:redoxin domain-containing protein [Bythopirellula polymerisocia]TWU28495.1 Thiol-disulfide oxidoreductase YkuV [Bythopirellula polymerisocia]
MKSTLVLISLLTLLAIPVVAAPQTPTDLGQYSDLIPRHLLSLLHAPEVHKELGLTNEQVKDLEGLFSEIDGRWFAARILPRDQQSTIVTELEGKVWNWFDKHTKPDQQQRLQQLEYYSQAGRMLLRPDLAKQIELQAAEQASLAELARDVQAAEQNLQNTQYGDPKIPELQSELKKAAEAERAGLTQYLTTSQKEQLSKILGEAFDTTKLKRIYPMAPEFVSVKYWINSAPLKLAELRGKVVLVHFYAFQCHNCHANFGIYQRWYQELTDKGVAVVGIQTPETSLERDPQAVKEAARERGLYFPIMIDLESENWKVWGNTMWPTVYVVDKNGYIRHWWQGELNWKGATSDKVIEDLVDDLLAESEQNESSEITSSK